MSKKIETWKALLETIGEPPTIDLYYEEQGGGEECLLFIHGFGQNLYTWRHIIPSLRSNYRIISVDLKGFGKSPKPNDGCYTVYEQVRLLIRMIMKLNLKKVTLIGHSFGGGVSLITALYLSLYDKGRLVRLVLMDNPAYEQKLPPFVYMLRIPFLSDIGSAIIPTDIQIRSVLRFSYLDESVITDDAVAAYAAPLNEPGGRQALIHTARQMIPSDLGNLSAMYNKINVPVQLIWGAEDEIIPLEIGLRLKKALPNGRISILPGCGHVPQEEKPDETLRYITGFLSGKN